MIWSPSHELIIYQLFEKKNVKRCISVRNFKCGINTILGTYMDRSINLTW